MRKPSILMVALLVLVLALSAQTAFADQVYHSAHIDLMSVGGAPLRSGFVENIHVSNLPATALHQPKIYAHEVYVVNGAMPNSTFNVELHIFTSGASCTGTPLTLTTAELKTNVAGNGKAQAFFSPADADGLRGMTVHAMWTLTKAGASRPSYDTGCETIHLD